MVFNLVKVFTGLLLSLMVCSHIFAQDQSLFEKIYKAQDSLSYFGIVSIEEFQSTSLYEVSSQVNQANKSFKVKRIGSRKQKEVVSTDLSVLSHNDSLSCNAEFPQLCINLLNLMQFNIALLQKNYQPEKIDDKIIAGIEASCYNLTADIYRPSFKLCLDFETGQVLYVEIKDKKNEVRRRLSYVWIEYNPEFSPDTFDQTFGYRFNGSHKDFHKYLGFRQFLSPKVNFNWLPKGFVKSNEAPNMTSFDDGLVKFTVYIKPEKTVTPFYVQQANGLTVGQMSINVGDIPYKAILVGEVDMDAVEQILSSISIQ